MNRTGRPGAWPDFRALLKRHGIRPDKRLAQHFLFDPAALDRVVGCAELSGNETILEVGAGVGSLTLRLAAAAGKVIAVEVDKRLLPALREALVALHPYEVPELVALPIESGHPPYLEWLDESVS